MNAETWYEELDFFENPFSIKPIGNEFFGYKEELKALVEKINAGNIVLIHGDFGLGKTSILKKIQKIYGGKKKLIYTSCNRNNNDFDVDETIIKAGSMFSRLFQRKTRGLILLLDEVHDLSEDELSEIYEAYMDNYFKSIVCISTHPDEINYPEEMAAKVKDNKIELKGIDENDAVKLVRDRIGDLDLISDDMIIEIYKLSGNNPRRFLANCEDVCRYAVEIGAEKVSAEHLEYLA